MIYSTYIAITDEGNANADNRVEVVKEAADGLCARAQGDSGFFDVRDADITIREDSTMLRHSLTLGICALYAAFTSSASASMFLGQAPGIDSASVNSVVGLVGDDAFNQDDHVTSIDGDHVDEFGPKLAFYTVHDGDGNEYDSDDQVVQWWLEGVPVGQSLVEPFYVVIKVGGQDNFVYQWDTSLGDTFEDPGTGGAGFVDYHSMVYDLTTNPVDGSALQQGISHVAIVARMVPEPGTIVMCLTAAAMALIHRRRR